MKILVTGGAGFIGTNFVRYWLQHHPGDEITVLDNLTYAGKKENLDGLPVTFIKGDICDRSTVFRVMTGCDCVYHFAAESHVDRSIISAEDFVTTNVYGTHILLEAARKWNIKKFVHISTDEVYGSNPFGSFWEWDLLNPSSPYSATKAGSELLAISYYKTYGLPVVVTRSSNNYGAYQHSEKMIPTMILNALQNKPLPVYGDGKNIRDWLYVDDNCAGIDIIANRGTVGQIYNIASQERMENIIVVMKILRYLDKPESLITFVPDRPGHDLRYAISTEKIERLGWKPKVGFDDGLRMTSQWYQERIQ